MRKEKLNTQKKVSLVIFLDHLSAYIVGQSTSDDDVRHSPSDVRYTSNLFFICPGQRVTLFFTLDNAPKCLCLRTLDY